MTVKLWRLSWPLDQLILLSKMAQKDPTLYGNGDAYRIFKSLPRAVRLKYYHQKNELIGEPHMMIETGQGA